MEYIDKQFPLEYVENDWDNFLSEKVNGDVVLDFKRNISGGEFTTCDMPSMGFENARVDMIKMVGFE